MFAKYLDALQTRVEVFGINDDGLTRWQSHAVFSRGRVWLRLPEGAKRFAAAMCLTAR